MLPANLITGRTAKLPGVFQPHPPLASGSNLEEGFIRLWRSMIKDLPEPVREHRFASPRRWRFDFAWPDAMLAVEMEGMAYGGGRHQRRKGFTADAEKYREAMKLGWRVLRYTSDEWRERPLQIIEEVAAMLHKTKAKTEE